MIRCGVDVDDERYVGDGDDRCGVDDGGDGDVVLMW